MAKVKSVTISFPPSGSTDVVSYKLYIEDATSGSSLDYNSQFHDIGNITSVDISTLPGMITTDGVYHIGITAVDDADNESSMSVSMDVPLDFLPPDAPGAITITRL